MATAATKERKIIIDKLVLIFIKTTENKSARVTWSDGKSGLSVDFYPTDAEKSQAVVQHMKISDSENATELKEYWTAALNDLKILLEK